MRIAAREAEVDAGDASAGDLHVGRIRERADMGTALQRDLLGGRGLFEQIDQRRMRNGAVEGAAAMETVEADAGAAAKLHVAALSHIRRVGGEDEIELDRDVGVQGMR